MGLRFRRKEDCVGFLEKGLRASRSWRSWYFELKAFQCDFDRKMDLMSGF